MKPSLRKFALTTHITLSVGWIGAAIGLVLLVVSRHLAGGGLRHH